MASIDGIGPACHKNGISAPMLLSYIPETSIIHLPEVETVSNGLVLELTRFKDSHSQCTFKTLHAWVKDLYGEKWPQEAPTIPALSRSVSRVSARLCKLKKQHTTAHKSEIISEFLQDNYVLPTIGLRKGRVLRFSPAKQKLAPTVPSKQKQGVKAQELQELKRKMYAVTRNANKRLKRRDAVIEQQKSELVTQLSTIRVYERKLAGAETKVNALRTKLKRINQRALYWREKVGDIGQCSSAKRAELYSEIQSLKEVTSTLDMNNADLSETLESILASEEISTFENGKYTDDVRACVYELLSLNVGVDNITPVIRCVLKNIAHKSVGRLPSHGLTCQMILESLTVVQAHLGETLSEAAGYSTLQTDGTTKFGEHYSTFDVRTSEAQTSYTLGLRHVFSGSAKDTLETLKEILDDIDSVQHAVGKNAVSGKIISKIKNTMSDRHAAEKLFNDLLCDYRADILPAVADNWDQMTDVEKEQLTRMNNFFCGLHFLVGLADAAEETLKQWEAQSAGKEPPASSGTQRLVRTACKAFHHRGSQQCGSSAFFRTFMKKQDIHKIPLAHFVGNRFNILFYDAAGVYYLRDHMITFIKSVHGGHANRLLQAVLADLQEPTYTIGCRALGLIDKVVTGPLWRKLSESSLSVLDMGSVYCEMKEKFDSWNVDARALVEGRAVLEHAKTIHEDEVWDALIECSTTDALTQELLQLLCNAFSLTTQRLLLDHLPGGKYHSVTDTVMTQETTSVPTTNVAPERDFAVLDRLIREKPNARLIALESMILYSHNKAATWLEQQTSEDRERLLHAARSLAPIIRSKFKARRQEIEAKRKEALVKKQENITRKQLQVVQEKERLTKEIEGVGLWTSRDEIDQGLEPFSKKAEKLKLLKLQINFRRKVLGQVHSDSSVFRFSHNRKQHSVCQLKQNLCRLLTTNEECPGDSVDPGGHDRLPSLEEVALQPARLCGRRIRHRFQVNAELVWYEGTVLQFNAQTKVFEVAYDGEDEVCSFPLLDDIRSGDLLIVL